MASALGTINELSTFIKALSSLIKALSSLIDAINEPRPSPRIYSFTGCSGGGTSTTSSDCLPIRSRVHRTPQLAKGPKSLGKIFLVLTCWAIVVLFTSLLSSSPSLITVLSGADKFVTFSVSFAALCLRNTHPRISFLLDAVGVCIVLSLLVHQNYAWICWLACASIVLAFIISLK